MLNRRSALAVLGSTGIGTAVFQRALAARAGGGPVSPQMVADAEWVAGIKLTEPQREAVVNAFKFAREDLDHVRPIELDNSLLPGLRFAPFASPASLPDPLDYEVKKSAAPGPELLARPDSDEDLAFSSIRQLGKLLRHRHISSVELTTLCLQRLRRYDPLLRCVVTYMDELALRQAERADQELRAKNERGPLHGIPWGIKDIFSYPGYSTTWGVGQYRDRVIDVKAAVAERLENAGAVLVAKLATNTLAGGSVLWYRGITRNPWNPPGCRRFVIGVGRGRRRRTRRLLHRHRNLVKPHRPFQALRCRGTEADVRTREPTWLHATLLVARQDRANLPRRRRLRPGPGRDSRRRSARCGIG